MICTTHTTLKLLSYNYSAFHENKFPSKTKLPLSLGDEASLRSHWVHRKTMTRVPVHWKESMLFIFFMVKYSFLALMPTYTRVGQFPSPLLYNLPQNFELLSVKLGASVDNLQENNNELH